jgi:hypothetical protein
MLSDDSGHLIAEQATSALGCLARYGDVLRPTGANEVTWRLEMLEELVRTGRGFAGAVAHLVGDEDPSISWMVRELAAAIDLHCDRVVRAVRERPGVTSLPDAGRVVAFPTPYVRTSGEARAQGPATGGFGAPPSSSPSSPW